MSYFCVVDFRRRVVSFKQLPIGFFDAILRYR